MQQQHQQHLRAHRSFARHLGACFTCLGSELAQSRRWHESRKAHATRVAGARIRHLLDALTALSELVAEHPVLRTEGRRAKLRALAAAVLATRPELWARNIARQFGVVLRTMSAVGSLVGTLREMSPSFKAVPCVDSSDEMQSARQWARDEERARHAELALMSGDSDTGDHDDDD